MDAIIGRYKVRVEETGLILRHPTGLSFDLDPNEVLGLWSFINFFREPFTGNGHADAVSAALSKRARGGFHSSGDV